MQGIHISELINLEEWERTELGYEVLADSEVEALKLLHSKGLVLENIFINNDPLASSFLRADYIDVENKAYLLISHLDKEYLDMFNIHKRVFHQIDSLKNKEYYSYLSMVERRHYSYVIYHLLDWLETESIDTDIIWNLFLHIWIDAEYLNGNILGDILLELFRINPELKEHKSKLRAISNSDTIEVYRGEGSKSIAYDEGAISWTIDKEKALFFANRFNSERKRLITAKVDIDDILAYLTERNESEVVVEFDKIKDVSVEEL